MPSLEDSVKSKAYVLFDQVFHEARKKDAMLPDHQSREYYSIRRDFVEYFFRSLRAKKETEKSPLLQDFLNRLPQDLAMKLNYQKQNNS